MTTRDRQFAERLGRPEWPIEAAGAVTPHRRESDFSLLGDNPFLVFNKYVCDTSMK